MFTIIRDVCIGVMLPLPSYLVMCYRAGYHDYSIVNIIGVIVSEIVLGLMCMVRIQRFFS